MKKTILVIEQTRSFLAGIEAAKCGNNINNSYPFNFEEFVAGYKTIKPEATTMLDESKTPESRLKMLEIIQLCENG